MADFTDNLGIPFIFEGQAGNQALYNEGMNRLDGLVNTQIEQFNLNTPPAGVLGNVYHIGNAPTGAWVGHEKDLAYWDGTNWLFTDPRKGFVVYDDDTEDLYVNTGSDTYVQLLKTGDVSNPMNGFIQGLQIRTTNGSTIVNIRAGAAISDDNDELMETTSTLNVDGTASGKNGLDTGALANNTWYNVWLIKDTSGPTEVAGLLSLSTTAPTMPAGFTEKRRIGVVRYFNFANRFLGCRSVSDGALRRFVYDEHSTHPQGTAGNLSIIHNVGTVWPTTTGVGALVPPTALMADFYMAADQNGTTRAVRLRRNGSTHDGIEMITGSAATQIQMYVTCEVDSSTNVEFGQVGGAGGQTLDLNVVAYYDDLRNT